MLKDRQLILAKIHATSADPVPAPETDAILASSIEFSQVARRLDRAHALQWMGKAQGFNVGEGLRIRFNTEVRGKGAGTAPEIDPLIRACNYTKSVDAGVSVTYTPNSLVSSDNSSEMVAIYFYQDKKWHKILQARGTVVTNCKAAEYAMDTWEFTGVYAGALTASAIPSGTFDTSVPPRFTSALCTIGGFTPKFKSLQLDLNNTVVKRMDANAATGILEWMITDREPKGSVDPEVPELTAATLTTALAGDNNDMVFTAHATNYPGITGNDITLVYADTATAGAETVTVTVTDIVVGVEAGVSTAAQVKTAVEASTPAMALLASVANAAGNSGAGTVPVLAETNLAGGAGLDFWKKWFDSAGMAIVATVGQTAGYRCKFTVAAAMLDDMNYADRENMLTHSLPFTIHPIAGNDDIVRLYY